jgi:hypothetical protein
VNNSSIPHYAFHPTMHHSHNNAHLPQQCNVAIISGCTFFTGPEFMTGREDEEEDVSSYWITLGREDTGN